MFNFRQVLKMFSAAPVQRVSDYVLTLHYASACHTHEAVFLSLGLLAVLPESSFDVRLALNLFRFHSLHQVAQELFAHCERNSKSTTATYAGCKESQQKLILETSTSSIPSRTLLFQRHELCKTEVKVNLLKAR